MASHTLVRNVYITGNYFKINIHYNKCDVVQNVHDYFNTFVGKRKMIEKPTKL